MGQINGTLTVETTVRVQTETKVNGEFFLLANVGK